MCTGLMSSTFDRSDCPLTIITYHYVRELTGSPFSDLKVLDTAVFRGQLDHIQRYYRPVSVDRVMAALREKTPRLPRNAVLLTFDDGLKEHRDTVCPLLLERGMTGAFFPSVKPVRDKCVLGVHKIQFVLASFKEKVSLVRGLMDLVDEDRDFFGLETNDIYWKRWARRGNYDSPETAFVKRMLQIGLPEAARRRTVDRLFRRFVTEDEAAFSEELYMGVPDMKEIIAAGMTIGGHGFQHDWLGTLAPEQQEREIDLSLDLLRGLGVTRDGWCFCYPHGDYDDHVLRLLREKNCMLGFTALRHKIADLGQDDPLVLPRLDTNDLPVSAAAEAGPWTRQVLS